MTAPAPRTEHEEPADLGLGRVVANSARGRFINRDGSPSSHKFGMGAQRAERFYQAALRADWTQFLAWLTGSLLLLNGIFALGFRSLGPAALGGTEQIGVADPFLRALVFSVGIFTRAGTGTMHAVGDTANWLVIAEAIVGVVFLIAAAGLIIARLTRPRMLLQFSESMVVAPYEGGRGLMFRMVNARPGELADVRVQLMFIFFETVNGVRERDFKILELERNSVEMLNLHWTVVHPINASSPLKGFTPEMLREAEAEFVISVNAHEETFSTRVRQRTSYVADEVRWDAKFASIFSTAADGIIAIDVERLSRTEPVEEGTTSRPSALENGPPLKVS